MPSRLLFRTSVGAILVLLATAAPVHGASVQWQVVFGTPYFDRAVAAAVAGDGSVVVVGVQHLDGLHPDTDVAFLRRYRPDGSLVWAKTLGATDASDSWGGVAVVGSAVYWSGATNGSLPGQPEGKAFFVRKLALAGGQTLWTRWIDGGPASVSALTAWNGDVLLAYGDGLYGDGLFVRRLDGGDGDTTAGPWDLGIARDAAGIAANASGVFVLSRGDVYEPVAGLALVKLSHTGNLAWSREVTGTTLSGLVGTGLAADADGPVATYQVYREATSHDTGVARYDNAGGLAWRKRFQTPAWDRAAAPAIDATGVYVARTSSIGGSDDVWVRKLSKAGAVVWTTRFGLAGADWTTALATGAGSLFAAGVKTKQASITRLARSGH